MHKLQGRYVESEDKISKIPGVDTPEISNSKAEAKQPAQNYNASDKSFHVLAHAGLYDDNDKENPWIGGLLLKRFVDSFYSKYGNSLEGGEIILMVCLIGREDILTGFLQRLHTKYGINNAQVYAPNDYMWISSVGKPHVAQQDAHSDTEDLNKQIAKYSADIGERSDDMIRSSLSFQDLGVGWVGAKMEQGVISRIPTLRVEEFIKDKFGTEDDF